MKLTKIPDDKFYHHIYRNQDDTVRICMWHTVMGSTRVVIHPNDGFSEWCSICCGKDLSVIMRVWITMFHWLQTMDDLKCIEETCLYLRQLESQGYRPFGANPEFVEAFHELLGADINAGHDS